MTSITFPRTLPDLGIVSASFEQDRVDYTSPEGGGRIGAVTAGFPLWRLEIDLTNLDPFADDQLRAWVSSQRGAQRRFLGFDPMRRLPRFYAGGIAFVGRATGWSQAINADDLALLTLTGLRPGQVVSPRDYVGFEWGDQRRAMVRSLEQAIANAAGSVTLAVEPAVPTLVPGTAIAVLDRPTCLMKLTAETTLATPGIAFTPAGGKIVAVQELLA